MTFVGSVVSKDGIGMEPAKVSAILDSPTPKSMKEVQSYLGFPSHLPHRKSSQVQLLLESGGSLLSSPDGLHILQHFQPNLPLTIEADASGFALGCTLSEPSPTRDLHQACFYSKKFTTAELNYPNYDKELLAMVTAFKQWRVYVEGAAHPIQVYTGHKKLEYFS